VGMACVITGLIAMPSKKRPGRHPAFGTIYYWCLTAVFASATALAAVRWAEDYHLFILGALSFGAASLGRTARRQRWHNWVKLHITGMGLSYIFLLTAFTSTTDTACRFGKNFLRSLIGCSPARSGYRSLSVPCCGIRRHGTRYAEGCKRLRLLETVTP
jgi:hypothetical protein